MCGICGYLQPGGAPSAQLEQNISRMANAIRHRGPDDDGVWVDPQNGLGLGFRRLAILDLSPLGHQPMASADERYVITFNGEIYNYQELRAELQQLGHTFKGHSDTEVMLAAFGQWGIRPAVERLNGMFAIALWDSHERLLYLIRDRLGVKPLYYGWNQGRFFFGSELKALKAHPEFASDINRFAMGQYLRFGYVPAPDSIYTGIHKLQPGSILVVGAQSRDNTPETYWKLDRVGATNGHPRDENQALAELEELLLESVRLRMIADVPLGAFLSGGVDSSVIVALMQAQSSRPIKTFTIGFHEQRYNEAPYAKQIANHLGTEHTELYVTPEEAMAVIPKLPQMYDEPFSDSSQIPTYLVSQLARRDVTVSLSGDGGDELFLGYNRYLWARNIWGSIKWLPRPARAGLAQLTKLLPAARVDALVAGAGLRSMVPQLGDKLQKLGSVLAHDGPEAVYEHLVTLWPNPTELMDTSGFENNARRKWNYAGDQSFAEWMSWLDIHTYLPDDILVKLDRASMAVSLEGRVPLLDDHRVVEFAAKLPHSLKHRQGKTKWLLRKLLYKYVPAQLVERPKMGFGVPIDSWLRGPLHEWAEDLLGEDKLRQSGLNPTPIRQRWQEHVSGGRNWQYHLWNVLMFQAWFTSSD
ncbi:MAG TPA: asparagine synthase (glutamine-hydrolyzing) [Anaerolineales bacterium]|nr:asparagine synthase (glutamine-hydrolyzing) [Anaerolineales bacterium]HRQ92246.1 asparagine synthase (glutamine-hydrolyzing) [Anaerolineales bacterium]